MEVMLCFYYWWLNSLVFLDWMLCKFLRDAFSFSLVLPRVSFLELLPLASSICTRDFLLKDFSCGLSFCVNQGVSSFDCVSSKTLTSNRYQLGQIPQTYIFLQFSSPLPLFNVIDLANRNLTWGWLYQRYDFPCQACVCLVSPIRHA